jgi:hypothetical protein
VVKLYDDDSSDLKKLKNLQVCRDIVKKINDFGVSQQQVLNLIYLLALELDNADLMKRIVKAISEDRPIMASDDDQGSFIITNQED